MLSDPEYGRTVTSEYVYDETVTLTRRRTGDVERSLVVGRAIRGTRDDLPSDAIEIVYSSQALFEDAVEAYERYAAHELSFTDAMTVAVVQDRDIDAVLSFDDDFDGVVERLVPGTVAAG